MATEPTPTEATPSVTTTPTSLPPAGAWPSPPPPPPPFACPPAPPLIPYPPAQPPYAGYVPPYYPGPMAPSTSYWAIASLVCALGGFVLAFTLGFGFLLFILPIVVPLGAILAVIFGHIGLAEIARSRGRLVGRGTALAGLITGYVILAIALFLGVVAFAAAAIRR